MIHFEGIRNMPRMMMFLAHQGATFVLQASTILENGNSNVIFYAINNNLDCFCRFIAFFVRLFRITLDGAHVFVQIKPCYITFQMKKKLFLYLCLATLAFSNVAAQITERNCGSMDNLARQLEQDPTMEQRMQAIERQTEEFVAAGAPTNRAVVTIPVVFHIIHNGDAVGSNENISDALIMAQLDQLNKDFRRLNSDASSVPSIFQGVAADAEVQFCLAQRTPAGAATTGINRLNKGQASWTSSQIESTLKPQTIWDRNKYLNLWTVIFGGSDAGTLGYAQFPGGTANTDGVVLLHTSVGSMATPNAAGGAYGKGRTATHEVGHWLNLRHIWGDANCGSDLVNDTPTHNTANYGCPTYPHASTCSGAPTEMTMNFMDYTDDACMYMYSTGQKNRMHALFGAGGSRVSLTTSDGCTPPSGASCGTPSGLASSNITSSSATVSWTAVSGAASYNVQYKLSSASTWTTLSASGTSANLTGLAAASTYNYQVQAVCSGASSAYSTASSFTTSNGTATCGNPTGLASSSITASSATVSWTAVSGATSYNVQFKANSSSTWITGSVTSNAASLTGLTAATLYNWQVQAVCASGSSSYVAGANFTTSSSSLSCTVYESNNTKNTSTTRPVNSTTEAFIGSSSDVDWYKFTTTSSAPKVRVRLTSLPADYDFKLYRGNTTIGTAQNGGTTDEQLISNSYTTGATWYVKVYPYSNSGSCSDSYLLDINTSATNFRTTSEWAEDVALEPVTELEIAPNPINNTALVILPTVEQPEVARISVLDLAGRTVMQVEQNVSKEQRQAELDFGALTNGMYIVYVQTSTTAMSRKVVVNH